MIDFIKLAYSGPLVSDFAKKHWDELVTLIKPGPGEIPSKWLWMRYGNYRVRIYLYEDHLKHTGGHIEVRGSLHKNFFEGANYKRFDYDMLLVEIGLLEEFLCIPAKELRVVKLEFGVNVGIWEPPIDFLSIRLISMGNHPFIAYRPDKQGKSLGYYAGKSTILKIYDKGLQFGLENNLMRVELRLLRSASIRRFGIRTLADIREKSALRSLGNKLLALWKSVLLYDAFAIIEWQKVTRYPDAFHGARSHSQWMEWKKNLSPSAYFKKRKSFKSMIDRYGEDVQPIVCDLLIAELKRCINPNASS